MIASMPSEPSSLDIRYHCDSIDFGFDFCREQGRCSMHTPADITGPLCLVPFPWKNYDGKHLGLVACKKHNNSTHPFHSWWGIQLWTSLILWCQRRDKFTSIPSPALLDHFSPKDLLLTQDFIALRNIKHEGMLIWKPTLGCINTA